MSYIISYTLGLFAGLKQNNNKTSLPLTINILLAVLNTTLVKFTVKRPQ